MAGRIIVVGAGMIGAAIALQMAQAGWQVTVISAGKPTATAASFGWINASFYLDDDHHRLRAEGIAAWHRLEAKVPLGVDWSGCLCWDMAPAELARTCGQLQDHGYPVTWLERPQIAARMPALRDVPEAALWFPQEGAAPSADLPARLLRAAQEAGARLVQDVSVTGVVQGDNGRAGVETQQGVFWGDQVILAAGTATQELAQTVGGHVPLVPRPAYILRTGKLAPLLDCILASPIGEIRQEPAGQLLMPVAVNHQADSAETLAQSPEDAADEAMARLRGLLFGLDGVSWAEITAAARPVPADGLPVVGQVAEGVYAACLHSGITLGPIVAELVCQDISGRLDNAGTAMLAPYRPDRFR